MEGNEDKDNSMCTSSSILHNLLTNKNNEQRPSSSFYQNDYNASNQKLSRIIKNTEKDLLAQTEELKALGISVMDQVSLERNVEAAVCRILFYFRLFYQIKVWKCFIIFFYPKFFLIYKFGMHCYYAFKNIVNHLS